MLRREPQPPITRIDMTPMADILICLLVLFMANAPTGCSKDELELPRVSSNWPSILGLPESIPVGLTRRGRADFRGERLDDGLAELSHRLRAYIEANPGDRQTVDLKADTETPFAEITNVIAACRKAGATDVRLVAEHLP